MNEAPWIGYSILACLDQMHEFIYAVDSESSDGTWDLLTDLKAKEAGEKLKFFRFPHFDTRDTKAYNASFKACIDKMTGESAMFLHPDQIILNPEVILGINADSALAWFIRLTSYVGDLQTIITEGRTDAWKNIHRNKFGLHYAGAYGSQNEDFYHSDITGKSYRFYGFDFNKYPFAVGDSGIKANHYCEVKPYERRLEKMIRCLRTQNPEMDSQQLQELAECHPRVSLKPDDRWGRFRVSPSPDPIPDVILKNKERFESYAEEGACLSR